MANLSNYGFFSLKDQATMRVSEVGVDVVNDAVRQSVDLYQRELNQMLSMICDTVTWHKRVFNLPSGGSLQPLDEHGNPLPRIPTGSYEVGLPIQGAGDAWGDNRITRAQMRVEEADLFTSNVVRADADWMLRHVLAAWFTNADWSYPDPEFSTLTVKPIANGDSVVYVRRNGTTSTDNHFLAQASAIDNSNNPFDDIYQELSEHPSNAGPYVAYIPTNVKAAVTALSNFVEIGDPDITKGANSDTLIGQISQGFGDEVLGKTDNMWIVQYDRLPNDYILGLALGAASRPFAMRQYPEAQLQGLFPEFQDIDGNRHLNKFIRYCGFGAQNRVAAVVQRVSNGSYAIPTGYSAPLAD